jgi:hypothetical protein
MYFVTTLRVLDKDVVDDCRTVGYFSSYGEAYDCCKFNRCDIFEDGFYNYAVITSIEEGLYSTQTEQQWFKRNHTGTIDAILEYHKRPDMIKNYRPYIIG